MVLIAVALLLALGLTFALTSSLSVVPLVTGPMMNASDNYGMVGCYTSGAAGPLTADATYGIVITDHGHTAPVKWPTGFTGRRSFGGQVEVLDPRGNVVVRTGTNVSLMGGYEGTDPRYFIACGWMKTY